MQKLQGRVGLCWLLEVLGKMFIGGVQEIFESFDIHLGGNGLGVEFFDVRNRPFYDLNGGSLRSLATQKGNRLLQRREASFQVCPPVFFR